MPSQEFSCPHYDPLPGKTRCRHYLDGGACARLDQFMCVEWLRANGHPPPPVEPKPALTDLFGNPLPEPRPRSKPRTTPAPSPVPETVAVPVVTDEQLDSFKALGVEVCLHSERTGEVWLVPEYRDPARREISVEHAATLRRLVEAFPGARVVSFTPAEDEPS